MRTNGSGSDGALGLFGSQLVDALRQICNEEDVRTMSAQEFKDVLAEQKGTIMMVIHLILLNHLCLLI